jgi:hypothetical protein
MSEADASGWGSIDDPWGGQVKAEVVVVIAAGGIGMAIARRQGFDPNILLADFNET